MTDLSITARALSARVISLAFVTGALLSLGSNACVGGTRSQTKEPGAAPAPDPQAGNAAAASGPSVEATVPAGVDPNFQIFLLIGQSNMEGIPKPEKEDAESNPRVKVLAYDDCPNLGRKINRWYTAAPPLHGCYAGVGPGDAFGKTLAAANPNATIGLVPCAISGVDIDFFRKGVVSSRRREFRIPPDNHYAGAYEWVIERAKIAQASGVIRGIAFHQGESDTGQQVWIEKVKGMVTDLRGDLGLGDAPFVAGELLSGGCCASHNPLVNQLPLAITNAFAVTAGDLKGMDSAHFDLVGQRELGRRYAEKMLQALGN
jgi:hypothetical protein